MLEDQKEVDNVIDILHKAKKAIREDDVILLRQLSDRTVHTASMYKDIDSVLVAVTVYALSKIIERKRFESYKSWPNFFETCSRNIDLAEKNIRQNKIKEFRDNLVEIRKAAEKLSGNLKKYITDIFEKAAVNKASRLYEHGLSFAETAELFGVTQWELAEYVGKTGISDVDLSITMPIKERINFTKKLFGK